MKPAGYSFLMDRFSLDVRMPRILSSIHGKSDRKSIILGREEEEYYPKRYDPGDRWQDHIQFALKHEGVDLEILTAFFSAVSENDIADLVRSAPTGRYVRIAWFLYEWLTGKTVPVPDLEQGNYVPVLDPARYYTFSKETAAPRIRRQRIVNNLPGEPRWCPLVRKTAALQEFDASGIDTAIREKLSGYPPGIVSRAVRCLSARETRSSWEIEGAAADSRRATRFMELLRRAGNRNIRSEAELVKLQNVIVEDRYAASGFRKNQTYVGQTIGPNREIVHYVPPKPEDIPGLMEGWMNAWEAMERGAVHPVIIAAVVGFGFVFLHPFEDGNGRLHRFLIHHALAAGGFTPEGIVFPVSAAMLARLADYEAALEDYSRDINGFVEYRLDENGVMTVLGDTAARYRYPDLTRQTEALFGFIRDAVEREFGAELDFLTLFDAARSGAGAVVDMPNRNLDLFVRLCLQGNGRVSRGKRKLFSEISDDEFERMETAVRNSMEMSKERNENQWEKERR